MKTQYNRLHWMNEFNQSLKLLALLATSLLLRDGGYYLEIFITVKVEALQESASRQQQRTTYYCTAIRDQRDR